MAAFVLPVRNDIPVQRFRVELSDEPFIFTFRLNPRRNRWFMDITTAENELFIASRAIVLNDDILKPFRGVQGAPQGAIIVSDLSNEGIEPDDETFGDKVSVIYEEAEEETA